MGDLRALAMLPPEHFEKMASQMITEVAERACSASAPTSAPTDVASLDEAVDPKTYSEAMRSPWHTNWTNAANAEYKSMEDNNVMRVVDFEPWMAPLVDRQACLQDQAQHRRHPR
jgi:hypothetical protein